MNLKFTTLILFFFISLAHSQEVSKEKLFQPDEKLVFKTLGATKLSLHVFNPQGHKPTDKVPVIVFFFGGGWIGGSPKQFYEQSRYFAQKGIVAISAEYKVYKTHKSSPFDAVSDAKSAIRWVRKHANELGIDPNKIVAAGGSAGGHIAACSGLIEGFDDAKEDLRISSTPNAMVLFNPVLDTTEKGYGLEKVGEERKTDISPVHHIRQGIVPTIVFHGKADKTAPFENAERFVRLMKAAKNDCVLESYQGKDHGFFNSPFFSAKKSDKIVYADIMEKSYAFLKSRLMDSK